MDTSSIDVIQLTQQLNSVSSFSEWAKEQLLHNQFLIAGVLTLLSGSAMYVLRNTPFAIWGFFERTFSTTIVVQSTNEHYASIGEFVNKLRINFLQRSFLLQYDMTLGPGYGTSFMWFAGRPLFVTRTKEDSDSGEFKEMLTLQFMTRSHEKLHKFVQEVVEMSAEEFQVTIYQKGAGYRHWDWICKRQPRPLDGIFIPVSDKKELIQRINRFRKSREWYMKRGIPYKLGILLHGIPGTGKSSLIHALASHFELAIRMLNLNTASEGSFFSAFAGTEDSLVVIEDIDTFRATAKRKIKSSAPLVKGRRHQFNFKGIPAESPGTNDDDQPAFGLSLSSVLNAIDGLPTSDGLILVATTNHINKLDPALIRKGRFDFQLELTKLKPECIKEMFLAFYGKSKVNLINDLLKSGKYDEVTGADAQDIFMHSTPKEAIEKLRVKSTCNDKETKNNGVIIEHQGDSPENPCQF